MGLMGSQSSMKKKNFQDTINALALNIHLRLLQLQTLCYMCQINTRFMIMIHGIFFLRIFLGNVEKLTQIAVKSCKEVSNALVWIKEIDNDFCMQSTLTSTSGKTMK